MLSLSKSKPGVPNHIAIIMDGNGRWAKKRFLPRVAGHKRGVEALRDTVKSAQALGVKYITVFAFSTENWRRPPEEVSFLMELFFSSLESEVERLHRNQIRLNVIGSRARFTDALNERISKAEAVTAQNDALVLTVAVDYGGRWDMLEAVKQLMAEGVEITEAAVSECIMQRNALPEPDLFIRTGGEKRISNFLLWQLAYTELYFTDLLWPDFGKEALLKAVESFGGRERRFGRTSEQLPKDEQRG